MKIMIIGICILLFFIVGCKNCEYKYIGDIVDFEISAGGMGAASLAKVTISQNQIIIIKNTGQGISNYNAFDHIRVGAKVYENQECNIKYKIE